MIIAFISSKIPDDTVHSDIIIKKDTEDWIGTGLTMDSLIRLHKIVTIPKTLIKRRLGKINSTIENETKDKIQRLFDIE